MSSINSDLDCWTQYSYTPCSPCSSGSTMTAESRAPPTAVGQQLTILLPNLIDRSTVLISDLEQFLVNRLGRSADITILHLLIYLFSINQDRSVTNITHMKLIHRGRSYSIQRALDLLTHLPKILDVIEIYPTFQLMITPTPACAPLKFSVNTMLSKLAEAAENRNMSSVTYAEAVVKLFKGSSRKLSVGLIESRPTTTRHALRDSATDVEDESNIGAKSKFKKSLRRLFKMPRDTISQQRMAETYLIAL